MQGHFVFKPTLVNKHYIVTWHITNHVYFILTMTSNRPEPEYILFVVSCEANQLTTNS